MNFNNKRYVEQRYLDNLIYNMERLNTILGFLPKDGKLLEIGTADGTTIKYYKQKFLGKTYGIDVSKKVLKKAAKYLDEVKVCDLNKDKIPYNNNSFNIVICSEVIEHIYDTDRLLQEIKRILKKDGVLIISTPNLASLLNRIFILFGFQPLGTDVSTIRSDYGNKFRDKDLIPAGHIRNFTYNAFRDIIIANGFNVIDKKASARTRNKFVHLIEKSIGKLFIELGSNIIFKCKKRI